MGGHAFKDLCCPRISPEVYCKVKLQSTAALRTIFSHVVVPTEMPCKEDYGDVDFLVSGFLNDCNKTTIENFDWEGAIRTIKAAFNTIHGRRGVSNPDCMYFAIVSPNPEDDFYIQVDVKVCLDPDFFDWCAFEYNYASNIKIIGSMIKPLGLTIDPKGFHVRVEEIEENNFPGSMTWVSKSPKDLLRLLGLDRRIINSGFKTKDEIYEYFTRSWVFNPAHFEARIAGENYSDRLETRSPHWIAFIKDWIPEHYPGYRFPCITTTANGAHEVDEQKNDLQMWYKATRAAMKEKIFTSFPHIASMYYLKRSTHLEEQEERRLRDEMTKLIPLESTGWKDDLPQPKVIVNQPDGNTTQPAMIDESTLSITPSTTKGQVSDQSISSSQVFGMNISSFNSIAEPAQAWDVPLYIDALPRQPPVTHKPRPPPVNMSPEAKLLCLARWTLFDSSTGLPYIRSSPRDKDSEMRWTDAIHAGATEEMLKTWAKEMWWHIWIRQSHVNCVGMWKKRFEKEDKKAESVRSGDEERLKEKEKIMSRLQALRSSLGLVEKQVVVGEEYAQLSGCDEAR